jgi:hypothetical protein
MLPRPVSRRPFHRRVPRTPLPSNSTPPRPCRGRARIGGTCTWPLMPACCGGDGDAATRYHGKRVGRGSDARATWRRQIFLAPLTCTTPPRPWSLATPAAPRARARAPLESPRGTGGNDPDLPCAARAHGRRGATEPTIRREVRCIRPCFIRRVAAETDYLRAGNKDAQLPLRVVFPSE